MNEGRLPRRCYCVRCDEFYSLHWAAKAIDVEEGRLRRAILLEDLDAIPVPDDRQYLIHGMALRAYLRTLRPSEECEFFQDQELVCKPGLAMLLCLGVLLASVLVLLASRCLSS